jgi:hypothetical protein
MPLLPSLLFKIDADGMNLLKVQSHRFMHAAIQFGNMQMTA